MAPLEPPLYFAGTFAALYEALPRSDVDAVDDMLDRLQSDHALAEMRSIIRVGDVSLYATPRIYAQTAVYRITWTYDSRDNAAVILCITVAEI